MSEPSLHHYVPRLYLRNFANEEGRLWVFDKQSDVVFQVSPDKIAAEHGFNSWPSLLSAQADPLVVETAFAKMEGKLAPLLSRVLMQIRAGAAEDVVHVSANERVLLSEFISSQYFRTRETRDFLAFLMSESDHAPDLARASEEEKKAIVFAFLARAGVIEEMAESIHDAVWLFARNVSESTLMTSDHPVCVKNYESRMWVKGIGPLADGQYIVFPLSPDVVMYCKERSRWTSLSRFDCAVSPVALDQEMVQHENAGQVFASTRFIFSRQPDFDVVKDFIPSMGTDFYAGDSTAKEKAALERTVEYLRVRQQARRNPRTTPK